MSKINFITEELLSLYNEQILQQIDKFNTAIKKIDTNLKNLQTEISQMYSISKSTDDDAYASTYSLTKRKSNGTIENVGDLITIPKDMVVQSGSVEICQEENVPVEGYVVGDKYIDLVIANSDGQHIYIKVTDLINMDGYVKDTDYATAIEAGVIRVPSKIFGLELANVNDKDNCLILVNPSDDDVRNEQYRDTHGSGVMLPIEKIPVAMANYGIESKTQIGEMEAAIENKLEEADLSDYVKNTDYAKQDKAGIMYPINPEASSPFPFNTNAIPFKFAPGDGRLTMYVPSDDDIKRDYSIFTGSPSKYAYIPLYKIPVVMTDYGISSKTTISDIQGDITNIEESISNIPVSIEQSDFDTAHDPNTTYIIFPDGTMNSTRTYEENDE